MIKCKRCEGKGWVWVANGPDDIDRDICIACDSKGYIEESEAEEEAEYSYMLYKGAVNEKEKQ